jgi:hypothetical protein
MHRWIDMGGSEKWSHEKDNNRGVSSIRTKDCEHL